MSYWFRKIESGGTASTWINQLIEPAYNVDQDKAGKWFYAVLEQELKEISVERVTLVSRIVEYLFEKEPDSMTRTIEYLKEQLGIR